MQELPGHTRDKLFVQQFGLSCPTFMSLCDELRPYIKKEDTVMRKAIPVEQRVGVALYKLAHSPSYRQLSGPLAVSPSACQEICEIVFSMICRHLYPKYSFLMSRNCIIRWTTSTPIRACQCVLGLSIALTYQSKHQGMGLHHTTTGRAFTLLCCKQLSTSVVLF